jgi:hypothetical protein
MFPKAGGQYILRRHMENSLVFYTVVSLPWYKPVLSPP